MKYFLLLLLVSFIACSDNGSNKPTNEPKLTAANNMGENLFKTNCSTCHKPYEKLIGPALQGVTTRWESKALLYAFVRNSQEVIATNAYAKKLFEEYNQSPMLPYPQLSDEDINAILNYCDQPLP
jgi:mono/diheme cytochrome c family protein